MHLILGYPNDSCCAALLEKLAGAGCEARLIAGPLETPARHQLHIDSNGTSSTTLVLGDRTAEPIESVFVRSNGAVDRAGWASADHAYVQAETHAALLGWLFALDCPVVNRVNAELWYRARLPLLHWLGRLRTCGLPVPEVIISDDEAEIDRFRRESEGRDVPGAVFLSLAQQNSWLVGRDEWNGVMTLRTHGPVCLAEPHGPVDLLCIVGQDIIWEHEPTSDEATLSERLLQFTRSVSLEFVEIGLACVSTGLAVVHVELVPRLERFSQKARSRILDRLMVLLLGRAASRPTEALS